MRSYKPHHVATAKGYAELVRQSHSAKRLCKTSVSSPSPSSSLSEFADNELESEDGDHDEGSDEYLTELMQADGKLRSSPPIGETTLFHDATGPATTSTSRGGKYFMLFFLNGNIHAEIIRSTSAAEQADALERAISYYIDMNQSISANMMDNDSPATVQKVLQHRKIPFQLVPRGVHRANKAELAVKYWKRHWLSSKASLPTTFPYDLEWDRLTRHVELTLSLCRRSKKNPKISQYEELHGKRFDWNKTPINPPGCPVQIYETRDDRGTWDFKTIDAFALCPSMNHYRSWCVYVPSKKSERITASVTWFPEVLPAQDTCCEALLLQAANSLYEHANAISADTPALDSVLPALKRVVDEIRKLYAIDNKMEMTNEMRSLPVERTGEPLAYDPQADYSKAALEEAARRELYRKLQDQEMAHLDEQAQLDQQRLDQLRRRVWDMFRRDPTSVEPAAAALHTCRATPPTVNPDTPSTNAINKNPALRAIWKPYDDAEIDGLKALGALQQTTEDVARTGEIIPTVWQRKVKRKADGSLDKMKSRVCLDGSVEYNILQMFPERIDNYSPNIRISTLLLLTAFGIERRMCISDFDVTQAYPNAPYTRSQPLYTYVDSGDVRIFYEVKKMIYGMPDAGRAWYEFFKTFLEDQGFTTSIFDPCLFVKFEQCTLLALGVSTDDALCVYDDTQHGHVMMEKLLEAMTAKGWRFTYSDQTTEMLSIKFDRADDGSLRLSTPAKIDDFVRYCYSEGEVVPERFGPFMPTWKEQKSNSTPTIPEAQMRRAVGLAQYPARTRFDIMSAVSQHAGRSHDPHEMDWESIRWLAAYLNTTKHLALTFYPADDPTQPITLWGAMDAAWHVIWHSSKSRLGGLSKLGTIASRSAPFEAFSQVEKGPCSMSATQAEARAGALEINNIVVNRGILEELGHLQLKPTKLYEDNAAFRIRATKLAPPSPSLKQEARMYHYIQGYVKNRTIELAEIESLKQPADPFTKDVGTVRNLLSLPMLLGHHHSIQETFDRYKAQRRQSGLPLDLDMVQTLYIYHTVASGSTVDPSVLHDGPVDGDLIEAVFHQLSLEDACPKISAVAVNARWQAEMSDIDPTSDRHVSVSWTSTPTVPLYFEHDAPCGDVLMWTPRTHGFSPIRLQDTYTNPYQANRTAPRRGSGTAPARTRLVPRDPSHTHRVPRISIWGSK